MTAVWRAADSRLERRFRRLLWAYPGAYRRRHGTEIVTTLLEMAEDGQSRRGEVWHLVASGLRQRSRLPAGRPMPVVGAVLAALTLAAFGAAAGSWLGWRGGQLPTAAAARDLAVAVAGSGPDGRYGRDSGAPWAAATVSLTADNSAQRRTVAQIGAALAERGWQVGPARELGGKAYRGDVEIPSQLVRAEAVRDGVELDVSVMSTAEHSRVNLFFTPVEPAAVRPLLVAGGLLGGLAGWLLAAAVADRSRGRRWVALPALAAVLVTAPATLAVWGNVLRLVRTDPDDMFATTFVVHLALVPGRYYPGWPTALVPVLAIAGAVLTGAALAVARQRPGARPRPAEGQAA